MMLALMAPRPEARRLLAADLFAKGKTYLEVAQTLAVSEEAARKWRLRWEAGGKEALKEAKAGKRGPKHAITDADARRLWKDAHKLSATDSLAELERLAAKRKIEVSRSALRRRLIALGLWPAGKAD
jgi:transposase